MALETRCCVSAVLLALVFIHYLMLVEGLNNDSNEGFMYNRAVRTPSFRNNEIMTARGFGKREHGHFDISKVSYTVFLKHNN